ncbi:MAG: hypothetical protein ABWK05_00930 [Pyrobaculum sp.]
MACLLGMYLAGFLLQFLLVKMYTWTAARNGVRYLFAQLYASRRRKNVFLMIKRRQFSLLNKVFLLGLL